MTKKLQRQYEVHIILGTHWDREWRFSFQETRTRLLEMIDRTLPLLETHKNISFTLDGQCMALDNYLQLRPRNLSRIKKLVRERRLLIGPWYSLPDMPVLTGESIVRNLLFGIDFGNKLGGAMMHCFTNSSWGQISQMPQICKSLGINTFFGYHGVPAHTVPLEFWWEGTDGSRVLFIRPPKVGKAAFWEAIERSIRPDVKMPWAPIQHDSNLLCNAYRMTDMPTIDHTPLFGDDSGFPRDYDAMCKHFKKNCMSASKEANTTNFFLGTFLDSGMPNSDISEMVKILRDTMPQWNIHFSSIPEYFKSVRMTVQNLKVLRGEMRVPAKDSYLYRVMCPLSSRMYLKQINRTAENMLTKWTEPFSAFAWIWGKEYPATTLGLSWQMMLTNHSHDNIGGCSVDGVHDDMIWRYRQITELSRALLHRSLGYIARQISSGNHADNETRLIVFNPSGTKRSDIVTSYVSMPPSYSHYELRIINHDSKPVLYNIQQISKKSLSVEFPIMGRPDIESRIMKVEFEAEDVPALGYAEYKIIPDRNILRQQKKLPAGSNWMENKYIKVTINADGSFDIVDKLNGETFKGLHYFENCGQKRLNYANAWYFIPLENDLPITSRRGKAKIKLIENTSIQTRIQVSYDFRIPESAAKKKSGIYDNKRSKKLVSLNILSVLTLQKNSQRLDVTTTLFNNATDHRLRVMFPTDISTKYCYADAPFDVVRRHISPLGKKNWLENQKYGEVKTNPMLSFVDIASSKRSLALIVDGLTEYEVLRDDRNTIALTLFRSFFNAIGDIDSPTPEIQGSQCLGKHSYRYSIYPHQNDSHKASVAMKAEAYNVPLKAIQIFGKGTGRLPNLKSFIEIDSEELIITAIKKTDKGKHLILRLFNPKTQTIKTKITFGFNIKSVKITNLLEEAIEKPDLKIFNGNEIRLEVASKKILTLKLTVTQKTR